jgi:hypothetical protein
MKPFVDIEGAGELTTWITFTSSASNTTGTLLGGKHCRIALFDGGKHWRQYDCDCYLQQQRCAAPEPCHRQRLGGNEQLQRSWGPYVQPFLEADNSRNLESFWELVILDKNFGIKC